MSAPPPLVVAILLNWNNSADTLACLNALRTDRYPQLEIVLVDNGSTDGSVVQLQQAAPELPIIRSPINRGFAGGVNQGLQYAAARNADYALLLNSDIALDPAMITHLVDAAQKDPQAGVLGPKVYHDQGARVFSLVGFQLRRSGIRIIGWHVVDQGQFDQTRIDAIAGCAMLISRTALRQVGLFDQRFFFYFEDIDYCLRVADAGLHIQVVPSAILEHELGGSTRRNPMRRQFLLGVNRMRFLRKHIHRYNPVLVAANELRELINQIRAATHMGPAAIVGYLVGLWVGLTR